MEIETIKQTIKNDWLTIIIVTAIIGYSAITLSNLIK